MILYNNATNVTDQETDNHYLPASHIQFSQGTTLLSFIGSHTNVNATITAGVTGSAQGDVMASFRTNVAVPKDASDFDRALGFAGRDPSWQPPTK